MTSLGGRLKRTRLHVKLVDTTVEPGRHFFKALRRAGMVTELRTESANMKHGLSYSTVLTCVCKRVEQHNRHVHGNVAGALTRAAIPLSCTCEGAASSERW